MMSSESAEAVETIISGSLQIAASRLLGQATQKSMAETSYMAIRI